MKKSIIVFDVDGTITESSKEILDENAITLNKLKEKYDIAVCGGGTLDKILIQMNGKIDFHHYFSECGCVYYKPVLYTNIKKNIFAINNSINNKKSELIHIYSNNIRNHETYNKINLLVKECLHFFSKVNYTLTGHFIDLRIGIIYVSCIGMQATEEERNYFKKINENECIRKELIDILKEKAKQLEIENKVSITYGGTVGIAIYPLEYDKIQILDTLRETYDEIIYFGDKYEKDGNDHNIICSDIVKGHKVDNVSETYDIIKNNYL